MYIPKYEGKYHVEVGTYGDGKKYRIGLPTPPPKSSMRNYGKPENEQFFEREVMPNFKGMRKKDIDDFVTRMWHLRRYGEWWLIKGKPVYLTGKAWTFLNFWTLRKGGLPQFRMTDVEWFYVWDHIERSPKCLGLFELKPRRIGETEKILFILWEFASRVRKSHSGIMSKTDADAKTTYLVMVKANSKMPFFFKPINKGNNMPQSGLFYDYPEIKATVNAVQTNKAEQLYAYPALESSVDYRATVLGAYDGEIIHRGYWDEVCKVSTSKVDIESQLGILSECATENVGTVIVGKIILASTVEDMEEGKAVRNFRDNVKLAQKIWDSSNPEDIDPNTGMTPSGFFRYFRSYENAANVDAWGYPILEEVRKARQTKIANYERMENWEQLARYKRKFPANEKEALMPSVDDCDLHPAIIDKRQAQLDLDLGWDGAAYDDWGNPVRSRSVRGNFEWVGVFGDTVRWEPCDNGRWEVSQHPSVPNSKVYEDGSYVPGNRHIFKAGIDPVGTMSNSRFRSDGGIAIFRSFDPIFERSTGLVTFDDKGIIITPHNMLTDQFVCTYSYRHDNPFFFFDDCLRTLTYYGCLGHLEEGIQYIENSFRDHGFVGYLQRKPAELGGSQNRLQFGTKATSSVIEAYVSKLKQHLFERWYLYHHNNLLKDMRTFNVANRGKHDLTVAAGYALLADMDGRIKMEREPENSDESFYPTTGDSSSIQKRYLGVQ